MIIDLIFIIWAATVGLKKYNENSALYRIAIDDVEIGWNVDIQLSGNTGL